LWLPADNAIDLDARRALSAIWPLYRSALSHPTPASWSTLIQVATEHNLTAYDAAYLELAQRTGLPLATRTPICAKLLAPVARRSWANHSAHAD
jgi:hypothetical protein